ncbi:15321_t:CDS:2, partial [Cetraspora pellucida]
RSVKQKLGSMEEYNEDDIDIATYFEETSHSEAHIQHFAKHKGFKVRLGRLKTVNTAENEKATRKWTILCKHSGLFKPKDSAWQSTLTHIMCPWHINLSCPLKDNPGFRIIVTTFNDNHNHDLSYEAIQFEKKQFTEEMWQEVEFLVTKCQLGATIV